MQKVVFSGKNRHYLSFCFEIPSKIVFTVVKIFSALWSDPRSKLQRAKFTVLVFNFQFFVWFYQQKHHDFQGFFWQAYQKRRIAKSRFFWKHFMVLIYFLMTSAKRSVYVFMKTDFSSLEINKVLVKFGDFNLLYGQYQIFCCECVHNYGYASLVYLPVLEQQQLKVKN